MARRVEVWLDGVALSSVGPIIIKEIHEDAPTLSIQYDDRPTRVGQLVSIRKRQSLRVAVEMQIRELFDLPRRERVCEDITRWARGSVLELSNHAGRRLKVICTAEPTLGTVRDYTSNIRVEFETTAVPYWEDTVPNAVTLDAGASGEGTVLNLGSADAPVCLSVVPSATLTAFSVTVGNQTIALTGLSVSSSQTLTFTRDARDDLRIEANGVSLLSKRSAVSADDLFVAPGVTAIEYTANTSCTVTASVQGRYA